MRNARVDLARENEVERVPQPANIARKNTLASSKYKQLADLRQLLHKYPSSR